ncbi:MAG: DUF1599 domain-containing protein [Bacteroidales bacterium]
MEERTYKQFEQIKEMCTDIFSKKMDDYGSSWRVLRSSSITDQIFIKAQRIRSIQSKGTQKIDEGIKPEFIGIVNYSVIALIQMEMGFANQPDMKADQALKKYTEYYNKAKALMMDKNHDYGEAWRDMRVSSLVDIILVKLLRIKQIEDNKGITKVSEGIESNYFDIINYGVFALIKLELEKQGK